MKKEINQSRNKSLMSLTRFPHKKTPHFSFFFLFKGWIIVKQDLQFTKIYLRLRNTLNLLYQSLIPSIIPHNPGITFIWKIIMLNLGQFAHWGKSRCHQHYSDLKNKKYKFRFHSQQNSKYTTSTLKNKVIELHK